MTGAFKNFFITFVVSLIAFGLLGWFVIYPALTQLSDPPEPESSYTESDFEISDSDPDDPDTTKPDKKILTAVLVGKAKDGFPASVIYLRINELTQTFSYSYLPLELMAGNDIGVDTPIKTLFYQSSGDTVIKKISVLTGIKPDFYIFMGASELKSLVAQMKDPYLDITREIRYINPIYAKEYKDTPEHEIPEDAYIVINPGRNTLDPEMIDWLMDYNPNFDGSEYHIIAKQLYESLFIQFFTNSGTKNKTAPYKLWNDFKNNTNILLTDIDEYIDILFTYDSYRLKHISYPSDWTRAITAYKD